MGDRNFAPTVACPVGWRGDGSGAFPGAEPAASWDAATGSNIVWRADMPSPSHSSPIVVRDRVFTLSERCLTDARFPQMHCLDARSGRPLWKADLDHIELMPAEKTARARELWKQYCTLFRQSREWKAAVAALKERLLAIDAETSQRNGERVLRADLANAFKIAFGAMGKARVLPQDQAFAKEWERLAEQAQESGFYISEKQTMDGGYGTLHRQYHAPMFNELKHCSILADEMELLVGSTWAAPVSDGLRVYVVTAGDFVGAYDMDGRREWAVWDPHPEFPAGATQTENLMCSVAVDDVLIVAGGRSSGRDRLRIRAYRKDTGAKAWEAKYWHPNHAGGIVTPVRVHGAPVVVTQCGWAFRAADGRPLAGWPNNEDWPVGTAAAARPGDEELRKIYTNKLPQCRYGDQAPAVVSNRLYYVLGGYGGDSNMKGALAVELTSISADQQLQWRVLWNDKTVAGESHIAGTNGYYGTRSVVCDGKRVYYVLDGKGLQARDAQTGALVFEADAKPPTSARPAVGYVQDFSGTLALAGRRLFHRTCDGQMLMFDADQATPQATVSRVPCNWQIAGKPANDDPRFRGLGYENYSGHSIPFFAGDRMFIRTFDALYCIGAASGGR